MIIQTLSIHFMDSYSINIPNQSHQACFPLRPRKNRKKSKPEIPISISHRSIIIYLLGGLPTPLKNDGVRHWEGCSAKLLKTVEPLITHQKSPGTSSVRTVF